MNFVVAEVGRYGLATDVLNVGAGDGLGIEFEAAVVGGKIEEATGAEAIEAAVDELGMVALGVEDVVHGAGIGEGRRVEDDEVVEAGGALAQPGFDVGPNE